MDSCIGYWLKNTLYYLIHSPDINEIFRYYIISKRDLQKYRSDNTITSDMTLKYIDKDISNMFLFTDHVLEQEPDGFRVKLCIHGRCLLDYKNIANEKQLRAKSPMKMKGEEYNPYKAFCLEYSSPDLKNLGECIIDEYIDDYSKVVTVINESPDHISDVTCNSILKYFCHTENDECESSECNHPQKLGAGKYGSVYKHCSDPECEYAVKIIHMNQDDIRLNIENFRTNKLGMHDLGPKIYKIISCMGCTSIVVMDYIAGQTLENWMDDERSADLRVCQNIVKSIDRMHRQAKIIHNDLNPNNVIVTPDNNIKFIDVQYRGDNFKTNIIDYITFMWFISKLTLDEDTFVRARDIYMYMYEKVLSNRLRKQSIHRKQELLKHFSAIQQHLKRIDSFDEIPLDLEKNIKSCKSIMNKM